MERRTQEKQDITQSYNLNEYPKELNKKITLLLHFKSYLEGDNKTETDVPKENAEDVKGNLGINFKLL